MKTTLLIPTLNEIDGMKAIMPHIDKKWVDQILVVDGGSTDGTIEYAKANGYEVLIQSKRGLLAACREAYPYITGDIFIIFSPDGNSLPERIPALIEKMKEGYDLVIVSRYLDDAKSEDDTFMTGLGNRVITGSINLCFNAKYTDALVCFRGYRTKMIEELGLLRSPSYFIETLFPMISSWDIMSSVRAAKKKMKVGAIAGAEPARIGGVTKCQHYPAGFASLAFIAQELLFWKVAPSPLESSRAPRLMQSKT